MTALRIDTEALANPNQVNDRNSNGNSGRNLPGRENVGRNHNGSDGFIISSWEVFGSLINKLEERNY
jgi:hypothetical protein